LKLGVYALIRAGEAPEHASTGEPVAGSPAPGFTVD
jgi:hypothetical protein